LVFPLFSLLRDGKDRKIISSCNGFGEIFWNFDVIFLNRYILSLKLPFYRGCGQKCSIEDPLKISPKNGCFFQRYSNTKVLEFRKKSENFSKDDPQKINKKGKTERPFAFLTNK
jgi:hypothetical protein